MLDLSRRSKWPSLIGHALSSLRLNELLMGIFDDVVFRCDEVVPRGDAFRQPANTLASVLVRSYEVSGSGLIVGELVRPEL